MESLTNEDAANMKQMLQLQNSINEEQKQTEKDIHEAQVEKDTEIKSIAKAGNEKLKDGDVKITEKREENKSMKDIARKKSIYEF